MTRLQKFACVLATIVFVTTSAAKSANTSPAMYELTDGQSRSVSAENPTGGKASGAMATEGLGREAARNLGQGWKISPAIKIASGQTASLVDVSGEGIIRHIWMTPAVKPPATWRSLILRIYWDGESNASVEVPLGDFFAMGLGEFAQINSNLVAVNPGAGFNCYWEMPFRKEAKMTVQNLGTEDAVLFYQIDYSLQAISANAAYFHAEFHDELATAGTKPFVILDNVKGAGQYVGTYMTYGVRHPGWWGSSALQLNETPHKRTLSAKRGA